MIDYAKELNPEQYRVVMEEGGPLLILAGAGSGKTRTLTYRVARLLETGVAQENNEIEVSCDRAKWVGAGDGLWKFGNIPIMN